MLNSKNTSYLTHQHALYRYLFRIVCAALATVILGTYAAPRVLGDPFISDPRCGDFELVEQTGITTPGTFFLANFPELFINPTDKFVQFESRIKPNELLPLGKPLGNLLLDAGESRLSVSLGQLLPADVEFGTYLFEVETEITEVDSGDPVATDSCAVQVVVGPAGVLESGIIVPVRWCVVEGSPQARGKGPGETVNGDKLASLVNRTNEIWFEQAQILFQPAYAPNGIPVIADPNPEFPVGDFDASLKGRTTSESYDASILCRQEWDNKYPNQRGLIVVNARNFINSAAVGQAAGAPSSLFVTGQRGDDLCKHPRNLSVDDLIDDYIGVIDEENFSRSHDKVVTLAHEFGHSLFLGHGNGLDDNMDGLEPPEVGIRRYDQYCDLAGTAGGRPVEDGLNPGVTSLMDPGAGTGSSSKNLNPLQIEQAREVAKLVPGAVFNFAADPAGELIAPSRCDQPPCGLPEDIFVTKVAMTVTPGLDETAFVQTVFGPIPASASSRYVTFADLDADPTTGCAPADLGFPTEFQGVEIVTEVTLVPDEDAPDVAAIVWRCESGALTEVSDSSIEAFAVNKIEAESGEPIFGTVVVRMANSVRGPATSEVRLQAIAEQIGGDEAIVRLPSDPQEGGLVSLIPPTLPGCEIVPRFVGPGGAAQITATGLTPSGAVDIYIGGRKVGSGVTDSAGTARVDFFVPAASTTGAHPLMLKMRENGVATICGLVVVGQPLTPATTALASPEANAAGWNNIDVTVQLKAIPHDAPVQSITYSASGAVTIPSTTADGDMVTIDVTHEGKTTIAFSATDEDGVVEGTQTSDVNIDRTLPSIAGTTSPPANDFGWNNTDVTVEFVCSDDRSGVLSCTGRTVLTDEGENLLVTGTALDLAGNEATTSIFGISIDKTPPLVTYADNTSPYSVLDTIDISCTATDNLSGIAATTCVDITGPAFAFEPGTNSFSAEATDEAGNIGFGSTTFDVLVSFDDLCTLTMQFIDESNQEPREANFLGNSLCSKLDNAKRFDAAGKNKQKAQMITVYLKQLESNTKNFFSPEQADILSEWANAL